MLNKLRPTSLNQIIGNDSIIENLRINLEVSRIKQESIPHLLIGGPPGVGKSSIALALANDLDSKFYCLNATNIKSNQYILPILLKLKKNDILFIDEIHRLKIHTEELLYTVLEDFQIYISSKERSIILNVPQFTMIGATTCTGGLSKPLRDRFPLQEVLSLYNDADLFKIIRGNTVKLGLTLTDDAVKLIGKCSRGTPRISNSLLKWVGDVATAEKRNTIIDLPFTKYCLYRKGIDSDGLTEVDRRYLKYLQDSNEPIGIETISAYLQIDRRAIEETIEPYLLQQGLLIKTKKGRVCKC